MPPEATTSLNIYSLSDALSMTQTTEMLVGACALIAIGFALAFFPFVENHIPKESLRP